MMIETITMMMEGARFKPSRFRCPIASGFPA